ncbi:hypothetical protein [Piscirickettsia litoralis]|uniref:Uncharacterized protein n=1 Tax=Piscirickettsia litoralis TaxID=1891921 RepID=A0ABX2ZYZ1_9GAMM|nr:hypothetical protein [Piscirickettsia litoralis]ODN41832.1 hypothetical protein BGC07_01130 [Piscirickettsia litoralis]
MQLISIREQLNTLQTSVDKRGDVGDCDSLQDLCFAVSIRQKSGFFHPKNTTMSGNKLVQLLNLPENELLRREIRPDGGAVRMRDVRHYARFGAKSEGKGYLFK